MATVADIAGIDSGKLSCTDSYSILPVLLGKSNDVPNQKAIVHHSSRGHFAIRSDEWKLIQGKGSGGFSTTLQEENLMCEEGQLYNLKDDPSETNNLYATRKDIVENLSEILENIKSTK
jgi:arylsulfatase A-like enzyme